MPAILQCNAMQQQCLRCNTVASHADSTRCLCRSAAEILQTLSSSGSSQWDVIQMLQTVPQLMALLTTGDFIAFPTWSQGSRLHEALQVALLGSDSISHVSHQCSQARMSDEWHLDHGHPCVHLLD